MSLNILSGNNDIVNPFCKFKAKVKAKVSTSGVSAKVKFDSLDTNKGTLYIAYVKGDGVEIKLTSNPRTTAIMAEYNGHKAII